MKVEVDPACQRRWRERLHIWQVRREFMVRDGIIVAIGFAVTWFGKSLGVELDV
jgi:hypothetical protein